MTSSIKPPALATGDLVGLVAPSGPFSEERFERGRSVIEGMGFRLTYDRSVADRRGYLAGSADRRLAEIHRMFADSEIKALWCIRGGFGSMHLLDRIDYELIKTNPKPFIGFSDITALHCAIGRKTGLATLHAPMVCSITKESAGTVENVRRLLTGKAAFGLLEARGRPVIPGKIRGRLCGGNLSVLTRLIGTEYEPLLDGCVLFLEDLDERPYRLDRMFTHMRLAGWFERIRGIIIGDLLRCDDPDGTTYGGVPEKLAGSQVVEEILKRIGLPCVMDFPAGHGPVNTPLPLGCEVLLDASSGAVTIEEPLAT